MSFLKRAKQILSANANAALDKMENPEKMIDQYIREAETALGEAKAKTADAMVVRDKCEKRLAECKAQIEDLNTYTEKAVKENNDADAEKFISKRIMREDELKGLEESLTAAENNATQMRQLHDQLLNDLSSYKLKRDSIRTKMSIVQTSNKISEITGLTEKLGSASSNFARMEDKVNDLMAKQNALTELEKPADDISVLKGKYNSGDNDIRVKAELEKFKNRLEQAV